jgi:hypothetical protein
MYILHNRILSSIKKKNQNLFPTNLCLRYSLVHLGARFLTDDLHYVQAVPGINSLARYLVV